MKALGWEDEVVSRDGNESYQIIEELGSGATSTVYLARCMRGRLLNRVVALKKMEVVDTSKKRTYAHLAESTSLHQSLHHPSILSLFSTFSSRSATYHVLELCAKGTLSDFIRSRSSGRLTEAETRGVMRSLVDALVYLRKRLVLHRDIKAGNVLLTDGYRIKLADFGLAQRLDSASSTATTFCGSPNYVSPEIIRRQPYSFSTDIWSLGCLMITCLSGHPPFEATLLENVFKNVCEAAYVLPQGISHEAEDLIAGLLQTHPEDRIRLQDILTHPFFDSDSPVHALGDEPSSTAPTHSRQAVLATTRRHLPPFLHRMASQGPLGRHMVYQDHAAEDDDRAQVTWLPSRTDVPPPSRAGARRKSDHIFAPSSKPPLAGPSRRIFSAPNPRRFPFPGVDAQVGTLASDFAALGLPLRPVRPAQRPRPLSGEGHAPDQSVDFSPSEIQEEDVADIDEVNPSKQPTPLRVALDRYRQREKSFAPAGKDELRVVSQPPLNRPRRPSPGRWKEEVATVKPIRMTGARLPSRLRAVSPYCEHQDGQTLRDRAGKAPVLSGGGAPNAHVPRQVTGERTRPRDDAATVAETTTFTILPIGTTRPTIISTSPLKPQAHRVAGGILAVLRSNVLLVDFREGERRRGGPGDSVLLTTLDGRRVQVFVDASAEDIRRGRIQADEDHVVDALPRRYWKMWNDAQRLVEQLKQRTPKLVYHESFGRCSLMSNAPHADIEVLVTRTSTTRARDKTARVTKPRSEQPTMRVRLARKRRALEIACVAAVDPASAAVGARRSRPAGDWTRTTLVLQGRGGRWALAEDDWAALDADAAAGVRRALDFLRVCEALEDSAGFCPVVSAENTASCTRSDDDDDDDDGNENLDDYGYSWLHSRDASRPRRLPGS